MKITASRAN